jgi:glyoxylase-like metal-dependent hydrolase (beta-lactamase superfamily II)
MKESSSVLFVNNFLVKLERRPEMIEVTSHSNVTCVKGSVKFKGVQLAVHLFLTDSMLIDSGPVSMLDQFIPFFEQHDFDFVALTHYHEDHTGCARWIQNQLQRPIYIHPQSIKECLRVSEYPFFRKQFWGEREEFTAQAFPENLQSRNFKWEVISTPGHSYDHVAFLNQDTGMMFSGDLFITSKPQAILPEESITQTILSLRTILNYDFMEMFCSHAGYIPDGKKVIQKKLHYLEGLRSDVLDLSWNGLSAIEINKILFPDPAPLIAISDYKWDSLYLVKNILKENE